MSKGFLLVASIALCSASHEFASFFRDALKCPDALFLDGTISSLYTDNPKRNDRKMDLGPIIGVTVPSAN